MRTNCAGCAGCCIDWRPIAPESIEHERGGARDPLDDLYNFVPLTRDDVRGLLDAGLADAMVPRLWHADGRGVEIDGTELAALDGLPVFFLGLRKPPKPVGPFGTDPTWLSTCAFLDPRTLQCRIHDAAIYPEECAEYPGHNLALSVDTECERVERAFGEERLLDESVPEGLSGLLLGPQAIGQKLFVHPDPDRLDGVVARLTDDALMAEDRAEFVAAAAAANPGTTAVEMAAFERERARVRDSRSWVGRSIEEWIERAGEPGARTEASGTPADPSLAEAIEDERGAPPTPGWE